MNHPDEIRRLHERIERHRVAALDEYVMMMRVGVCRIRRVSRHVAAVSFPEPRTLRDRIRRRTRWTTETYRYVTDAGYVKECDTMPPPTYKGYGLVVAEEPVALAA